MNTTGLEANIKRADLNLRIRYVGMKTEIYALKTPDYLIYCSEFVGKFADICNEFNRKIKTLTAPVTLTDKIPTDYERKIDGFDEHYICSFEGESFSSFYLLNLLVGKFQEIFFEKVEMGESNRLRIVVNNFNEIVSPVRTVYHYLNQPSRKKLEAFLDTLDLPFSYDIIEVQKDSKPDLAESFGSLNPGATIYASNYPRYEPVLYEKRDEALWFDHIDGICSGAFTKDRFNFYRRGQYACYVDYSLFSNIDLRNLLLLFEVIYVSPPSINRSYIDWFERLKITEQEFILLLVKGRIRLLLTQAPHQYGDGGLFNEIYRLKPDAIISRRAIAAIVQADLVEIADNYLLKDIGQDRKLGPFIEATRDIHHEDPVDFYNRIVWPVRAKFESVQPLYSGGVQTASLFGINQIIEKLVSKGVKKDVGFEFMITAPAVHISNALDAVYFPYTAEVGFTDAAFAFIMGDMLNMYSNARADNAEWILREKERMKTGETQMLNPVDLFEINDYISITELDKVLTQHGTVPRGKFLLETLAVLSPAERNKKINEYNQQVIELTRKRNGKKLIYDIGYDVGMDSAGLAVPVPFLGSVVGLFKRLLTSERVSDAVAKFRNKYEEKLFRSDPDKANVHFLAEINRVARLKNR